MATTIDTSSAYISAYNVNNLTTNAVDRLASSLAIPNTSYDPSNLTIADGLRMHERALSQSIDNSTSGIALSNIAQSALNDQKDILIEIKQLTVQASNGILNNNDRQIIANQIDKLLQGFESITNTTSYNGESLLKTAGDSSDDLSIVGEEKIISISKADTTGVSDNLRTFLGDFATNSSSRENMLNTLDQSMDELASFKSDFGSAANALESMVRNQLTEVTNTANTRSTIADIDYTKEASNFNKTNLLTQLGYLIQTQANAHTQRTIEILK